VLKQKRIGFIGAGNMAEALCRGILRSGLVAPDAVCASDISEARRGFFRSELRVEAISDNKALAARSDIVILAVKPQQMPEVLDQIGSCLTGAHIAITIAAGVRTGRIESAARAPVRVVRVMPNTPMLVGCGMAALCAGRHATREDLDIAAEIFLSAADVVFVEESMMDAVTALSGSGPAYFFFFVEALIDAGVAEGLTPEVAARLARQTCLGAGQMLVESEEAPAELRRKVTSPGGTTEAALKQMAMDAVKEDIVRAVRAAAARSRELGG